LPLALSKGRRAVVLAWVVNPLRSTVFASSTALHPLHPRSCGLPFRPAVADRKVPPQMDCITCLDHGECTIGLGL
jgi:hypothetical protein